ncbi:MAG: hypothetical protein E8D41_00305 [Nitrospira sp.]|nr:MAG: hypothetical protein E8D41_00305 [Nitrospira sp.]
MRHTIHQHRITASAISLGFMTVFLSLVQPVPSASAQQLTRPISQDNGGTVTQGQRIEKATSGYRYPTKPVEKIDAQTSTRKPHRLIRKPQSLPLASVEPSLSDSSSVNPVTSSPLSPQHDAATSQPEEPLVPRRSLGAAVPLAPISVTPSTAASTGFVATGTAPTGTIPLAAAGAGNSSSSGNGGTSGRTMRRLSAEMSGLTQLVSPPSAPTLSGGPAIGMSPASLSFTAQLGGNSPAAQILTINNTGHGTLNWTASDSAAWLSLSPASGTGTGVVTVSVATTALTPGSYSETITLNAPGATPVTIPVSFAISAAPMPPAIGASPTTLAFAATQGGSNPTAQTLSLSNTGGGTLTWSASESTPWLGLSATSGTGNGSMAVTVATGSLTVGTHNGTITLTGGATPVTIPVSFIVSAAPAIGASPTALSFTAQQGGGNPAAQTVTINNTGGGTLSWSVSHDATWLGHTPGTGTGTGAVSISVITGSLTVGTHSGQVTIWPAGSTATPVTIPVTFTVTPAPVPPAIGASPTTIAFTAIQGGSNPAAQTVSISNTGGGTLSWTASENTGWLTLSAGSGTGNGTVTLQATTGALAAGSHPGTVTVSGGTGVTPVTIPVSFMVTAAPTISLSPSSLSYAATQGAANPANQTISLTNTGGTVNWTVSDDASWLTVSPASGTGSSTLTASVNTAGLTAQTYTGTITVSAAGITSKTVAVTLTVNAPATSSATLTWSPNTESDLAGYKIYRATTSGGYGAPIATLQGSATTYTATGLQMGTTYYFIITAYDSAGNESLPSNEVSKSIF